MCKRISFSFCSNNTNKLSPQEQCSNKSEAPKSSNNTNKLSPKEQLLLRLLIFLCSNNTNKLSPQEQGKRLDCKCGVQIIQINLVLKNALILSLYPYQVQIIQINLVLKNCRPYYSIFMLYLQYILSISIIKC